MFHEMQEISWQPEDLFASHEGFCSMESVRKFSHSTSAKLKCEGRV